ncbi:hypothetical protein [uncultured Kordia sp.]|uniref:hypothetical protein n=1 Tax=uncultured Kordia sp. TaxID=507699 RepID=UPI0026218680|nr:hypothetical protein [uncultured Kordia sp.]
MNLTISEYLEGIAEKVVPKNSIDLLNAETTTYIPTNISQLCSPAIIWDWKVNPIGQISYHQFQLSDTAPLSSKSEVLFISSGTSISEAFRTFLNILKANKDFPLKAELEKLIAKNTPPEAYDDGWTKVLMNGNLEWKPDWIFSESVYSWKQKVAAGTIHNSGTIKVKLHKEDNLSSIFMLDDDATKSSEFISQFETVEVYADAWGLIFIRPGSWFSSSILKLGAPYMPKGIKLLTSRVASFYIADNPVFTFKSNKKINMNSINTAAAFQCFGIDTVLNMQPEDLENSNQITLHSKTVDPAIVGVVIEQL